MMSSSIVKIVFFITLFSIEALSSSDNTIKANFPLQISAKVEVTAHLVDASIEFPPRVRRLSINYDYIKKKARADIEEGYEAAKTYIRRYDNENEYMVRHSTINDCKRSYLGETMPFPEIPENAKYVNSEVISGVECSHFVHVDFDTSVHMYFSRVNGAPVRLIQESTANGVSTPLMTFDYYDVELGPISDLVFELPDAYSHNACERHIGGFPYLHVFHYFVRF